MRHEITYDRLVMAANQKTNEQEYWLKQLSGSWSKTIFPRDFNTPGKSDITSFRTSQSFSCSPQLNARLEKISRGDDRVLHAVLTSILALLLQKFTGIDDIILGTPIYKQEKDGNFINTALAIRIQIDPTITVKNLLKQTGQVMAKALENQNYPIEILAQRLNKPYEKDSEFSLFDVTLLLENLHHKEYLDHINANVGFIFHRQEQSGEVRGWLKYNPSLYKSSTIDTIANGYVYLLDRALFDLDSPTATIEFLEPQEKQKLLYDFNRTACGFPQDKPLHRLFEEQTGRTPDRVAIVGPSVQEAITYHCLNHFSNVISRKLHSLGVGRERVVSLMMNRTIQAVAGILGILKAGCIYLPIDPDFPMDRIRYMLEDSCAPVLLTNLQRENPSFSFLQGLHRVKVKPHLTNPRRQITQLDQLPFPDRSLVDYDKYFTQIGQAWTKYSVAFFTTRGCPYQCAYCHKIWPKKHVVRSAGNIIQEVELYYRMGVKRFVILDDIFNLNVKNSSRFFELIIEKKLNLQLFFPNGMRGDLLTQDYIDLMVKAGTKAMGVALETASPRMQKVIRKNLDLCKLREIVEYICRKYPQIILELYTMHGLPTETEEEALMTLDFIKSIKWIHFPYVNILRVYANTDIEKLMMEQGVSRESIFLSENLYFHEIPETLTFDRNFTRQYQSDFLNEYFLSKERLLYVFPYQMRLFTEDEIIKKYNGYFPEKISTIDDLLRVMRIEKEELKDIEFARDKDLEVPDLSRKIRGHFPIKKVNKDALKVILLDFSQFFSSHSNRLDDIYDPPLGLILVLTSLNQRLGEKVNGKIAKSRMDFDSYEGLKQLLMEFKPDVIGVRSLSYYKDFFHKSIALIRQWGIDVPIIAGGPYASSGYETLLQDKNIDLVVIGEGEVTFAELIEKIITNKGKLPDDESLQEIAGLAYVPRAAKLLRDMACRVIMPDDLCDWAQGSQHFPTPVNAKELVNANQSPGSELAYIIYTSGTTGKPKGVMVEHRNAVNVVTWFGRAYGMDKDTHLLQLTDYTFDPSIKDIFATLLHGAVLHIGHEDLFSDIEEFQRVIMCCQIHIVDFVPSMLSHLLGSDLRLTCLRAVISGGERLSETVKERIMNQGYRLYNHYGPTEITIDALVEECSPEPVTLGKPIANVRCYILNQHRQVLPVGIPGELYIGGAGVVRGYMNASMLTSRGFFPDPFINKNTATHTNGDTERMYRSGDMARWLPAGKIEFLGRLDNQVKIRGYRIEPGEIEDCLMTHKKIRQAVVLTSRKNNSPVPDQNQNGNNDTYLCAFFTAHRKLDVQELKKYLARQLPEYMIPFYLIQVDEFPLLPNGKVDILSLPEPKRLTEGKGWGERVQLPRNSIEEKLASIWSTILDINKEDLLRTYGIDGNFMEMGGNSLRATLLISQINKELNVKLSLAELFQFPTISGLGEFIKQAGKSPFISLKKSEKREYYALSSAQKRLYITQQMDFTSKGYNLHLVIVLEGDVDIVDIKKFEKVFRQLIHCHESLRTSFVWVNGEPVQRIHDDVKFEIEFYEIGNRQEARGKRQQAIEISRTEARGNKEEPIPDAYCRGPEPIIKNFLRPFDLSQAPLLRVGLIRLHPPTVGHSNQEGDDEDKYILIMEMHHIITDGASMTLLIKEFITRYHGRELYPLRWQYTDYSQWKNSLKMQEIMKKQETYWLKQFEDEIPVLDLPLDYPLPTVQSFEGDSVLFQMGKEETQVFKELANREGVTLFILLLTTFNILLSKFCGQEDIVIGTALAGRNHADLEKIIGLFLNTLALRNYPRSSATFKDFLGEIKERTLEAFENQDYPFEELIERLDVPHRAGGNPLYRVMLILQNFDTLDLEEVDQYAPGLKVKPYGFKSDSSTNDMTLYVEEGDNLVLSLQYCTKLFKTETIRRILRYFNKIASTVVMNPHIKLKEIEIITTAEREQILFRFNHTSKPFTRDKLYQQLFRQQVLKSPDRKAAIYGVPGECSLHITYSHLNERASRIAVLLRNRAKGADTASIIAVYMKRSINMLASIIGIFNAGFTYMPLDIDYPEERIKNILEDSQANLVITESRHAAELEKMKESLLGLETIVCIDDNGSIPGIPAQYPVINQVIAPDLHRLAYVIYTSGSTGKPKGVMIHHLGMLNHLYAKVNDLSITGEDIIAQTASACFDISVWQFLAALLTGASTFIIDREITLEPGQLLQVLRKGKITILESVPTMANAILNAAKNDKDKDLFHLKWMIITGEALGITLVREWYKCYPGVRLLNAYGPTEASDDVTHYVIDELPDESQTTIPIGKPLQNMQVYILDKHLSLCPIGVRGEICVAGLGVGKGYWQEPLKTQQAFIPNPFIEEIRDNDYMVVYKTGDIGYFREDGQVEFVDRKDLQVKVRGYRIELGEIESQLSMVDDIEEAVVMVIGAGGADPVPDKGERNICAYYVSKREIDVTHLREHLAQRLPHYMVPSFFVPLKEIPLTPQGKVDRKALPIPEIRDDSDYVPPANEKEKKLAAVFASVLNKNANEISMKSAFFEIGGHSLQAMAVVSLVKEIFQVKIPLTALFQDGTVKGITRLIEQLQGQETEVIINQGLITPFDLGEAPLFRVKVIRLQENRYLLFIDMHHIIADGFSLEIIDREIETLYKDLQTPLPELSIQYKDFSGWHNDFIASKAFKKQEQYWLSCFKEIPSSSIPLDYPRPAVRQGKGNTINRLLTPQLGKEIQLFYRQQQVTPFMFFLAAYVVLLSKISSTTDIIVGTPVSGRSQNGVDRIIGMFVNTLALRFKTPGNLAFYDFLKQVKSITLRALENQDYPFELLVQELNLAGNMGNSPLFDTLFGLNQLALQENEHDRQSLKITPLELKTRTTLFDLSVGVLIDGDDIKIFFTYDIALFKEETIQQWLTDFENLLSRLARDPGQRIAQLQTGIPEEAVIKGEESKDQELVEAERRRILEEFNNTASPLAADPIIHHRFEQQAQRTPDNAAVKWADQLLTYHQFHKRTNQLAHWLRKKGVTTESIVGIITDRCLEMMIGIFGILKAGGAYLPMSPEYPESRTLYTLIDSGAALLLTDRNLRLNGGNPCDMAVLKDLPLEEEEETNPERTCTPHSAAYILYTSGTTGKPKGVVVEHHSVVNFLCWMQEAYPLNANDILLQKTPIVFDVSVRELFWWVLPGALLCIPVSGLEKKPPELVHFCTLHHITIIHFIPAMLNLFLDYLERTILKGSAVLPALRLILASGEALTPPQVERFYRVLGKEHSLPLVNLYGPTETTIEVTHYNCLDWEEGKPVPIGKPINNVKMYIMKTEKGLELQPLRAEGELCIGGIGVGRGYLNRPELTAEKFIVFSRSDTSDQSDLSGRSDWSDRLYKTGDLARWLPDGNIEFLGRMDQQIKIRGYRIEPAEIETALLKHPRVREAAAAVRTGPDDVKYLVAGIVPRTGITDITVNQLRTFLKKTLLDYMIPQLFIKLDHMPLTTTGKVDRSKLEAMGKIIETGSPYVPPETPMEKFLARIWSEVLHRENIGKQDHFFDLGGDSLNTNLMMAKANEALGTDYSLEKIFDIPILSEFSKLFPPLPLDPGLHLPPVIPVIQPMPKNQAGIYPASSAQKRMYIRNQLEMESTSYNIPALFLIEGKLEETKLEQVFRKLSHRQESLRTSFLMEKGEIKQKVHPEVEIKVEFYETDEQEDYEALVDGKIPLRKIKLSPVMSIGGVTDDMETRRKKREREIPL